MKIGVLANTTKTEAAEVTRKLIDALRERGHQCIIESTLAGLIREDEGHRSLQVCRQAELILAVGGDGTILRAVNAVNDQEKPILGINIGRVGFLSEALPDEISHVLDAIDSGELFLDRRIMLQAAIVYDESREPNYTLSSFNDMSITRQSYACVARLDVYIQDEFSGTLTGDGILVSTPTGSSAYALSCGGPLVHPTLDALVITPISGHIRGIRPMVVPGDSIIRIRPHKGSRSLELAVDGKFGARFPENNEILLRRAPYRAVLAHIKPYNYFERVRYKIYGEDRFPKG